MSTEKSTQGAILDYLSYKNVFHYRQNSGAMKTERGGFYRFGVTGAPDIVAIKNGIYHGIEVKDIKGKQSDGQVKFQQDLESAGGVYILAKSLDDVMKYL